MYLDLDPTYIKMPKNIFDTEVYPGYRFPVLKWSQIINEAHQKSLICGESDDGDHLQVVLHYPHLARFDRLGRLSSEVITELEGFLIQGQGEIIAARTYDPVGRLLAYEKMFMPLDDASKTGFKLLDHKKFNYPFGRPDNEYSISVIDPASKLPKTFIFEQRLTEHERLNDVLCRIELIDLGI